MTDTDPTDPELKSVFHVLRRSVVHVPHDFAERVSDRIEHHLATSRQQPGFFSLLWGVALMLTGAVERASRDQTDDPKDRPPTDPKDPDEES